jgi:hypothetical protein
MLTHFRFSCKSIIKTKLKISGIAVPYQRASERYSGQLCAMLCINNFSERIDTMRYYLLLLGLLLCLTSPLHAQDEPTPYDSALQRIQDAAAKGYFTTKAQRTQRKMVG